MMGLCLNNEQKEKEQMMSIFFSMIAGTCAQPQTPSRPAKMIDAPNQIPTNDNVKRKAVLHTQASFCAHNPAKCLLFLAWSEKGQPFCSEVAVLFWPETLIQRHSGISCGAAKGYIEW